MRQPREPHKKAHRTPLLQLQAHEEVFPLLQRPHPLHRPPPKRRLSLQRRVPFVQKLRHPKVKHVCDIMDQGAVRLPPLHPLRKLDHYEELAPPLSLAHAQQRPRLSRFPLPLLQPHPRKVRQVPQHLPKLPATEEAPFLELSLLAEEKFFKTTKVLHPEEKKYHVHTVTLCTGG